MSDAPSLRGAGADAAPTHPIAGSIKPPPSDLEEHIEGWLRHLRSRRHKPNGYAAYRQKSARFLRQTGIRSCAELSSGAIMGWLDSHGERWSGSTYNNALSIMRSLTGYLVRVGALAEDPLAETIRAYEEPGDGSRAATTDEARRHLMAAWMRGSDKRSKGDRALYWACLFLHACRLDDPQRWRWKHLLLDEPIPLVLWSPDINKNRRREECVLAPELLALLRRHRERQRAAAKICPVVERLYKGEVVDRRLIDPDDPEAFVFGRIPTPKSFPTDRDRAGIEPADRRGRPFTSHSARKWFATTLTVAGVHPRVVDRLMRHKGGVQGRYFDPPLDEQVEALAALPRLWPDVDNLGKGGNCSPTGLTTADESGFMSRRACDPLQPDSLPTPGLGATRTRRHDFAPSRPGFGGESSPERSGEGHRRDHQPVESARSLRTEMAPPGFEPGTERL